MRRWGYALLLVALSTWTASALEVKLVSAVVVPQPPDAANARGNNRTTRTETSNDAPVCHPHPSSRISGRAWSDSGTGMYSKKSWGGPVDPFILVKFTDVGKDQGDDPIASLLIFNWMDSDYIGVTPPGGGGKAGICEQQFVDAGYCNQTDIGKYIVSPDASEKSVNVILTKAMHLKNSAPIKYPITKTGYYCVVTDNYQGDTYEAIVEFRNAYGELPATQIPKLPFYGGITIAYALVLAYVPAKEALMGRG